MVFPLAAKCELLSRRRQREAERLGEISLAGTLTATGSPNRPSAGSRDALLRRSYRLSPAAFIETASGK